MQFTQSRSPIERAFLALTLFTPLLNAQQSGDLTITFSKENLNNCATNGSSDGLSFSTATVPEWGECFNLDETFTQDNITGFLNDTFSMTSGDNSQGIQWVVYQSESFDPSANYSHIWYQQASGGSSSGPGDYASRSLTIYNGRDCYQTGDPLQPWFGWTCQSEDSGDCRTTPYSLKSFRIDAAEKFADRGTQCWKFAYQGAAARNSLSKWTYINAIVGAILTGSMTAMTTIL